jgi:hypothetical protein
VSRIKFRITIEHLWGLIALMGIFIFVNTHPIRPYDFWWHITIGREILTTRSIPTVDVYSYTETGQPYPSYQMFWLMETLLYVIYKVGGPALVVLLQSLMITAAYIVIFWICKLASNSWRIAAIGVLFAAALGINDWNVRPQGITFLIASLILLVIYKYKKNSLWGWLVIFPVCMLVWVNSHGTFLIGLVLLSLWWGQELWQAIIQRNREHRIVKNRIFIPGIVLGVTALACLVNPRGFGIINYLKSLTSNSVVQNLVTEWAPPTFGTWWGAIFLSGLMASAVLLALSPKRPDFFQITTFFVFGLLGLKTSRGIVWFGLVMAPIVAAHLSAIADTFQKVDKRPMNREGSRILNILFTIVIIAMGVISLPWFKSLLPLPRSKAGLISSETPVQATQALLEKNLPGRVFNAMSFGSYLIWAAYPQYQVFVDSRIELFSEKVWLDYLDISNADGDWEAKLKDYGVNTLMLSPVEQPALVQAVELSNGWLSIYQDPSSNIFIRYSGSQKP